MNSKKKIIYSLLGGFAIVCIILSCFIHNASLFTFFELPYQGMASLVKLSVIDSTSTFNSIMSWILFIVLGFLPGIYPFVQLIRKRPHKILYACWILVLVLSYITLYIDINPQILEYVIPSNESFVHITQFSMTFTIYLTAILLLLIELWLEIKKDKTKALTFSKVLLVIIALVAIENIFYAELSNTINKCISALSYTNYVGINLFHIILNYLLTIIRYIVLLFVLNRLDNFLDGIKENMFSRTNEELAHKVYKSLGILIALDIGLAIINNLITFVLQKYLYNIHYSALVDLSVILVTTLSALFIIFMTKSIEIKEDNDLTI